MTTTSTYFGYDRVDGEELRRLQVQDQLLTAAMGGVLPEQANPGRFSHVLDVGCGTGDWLLETANRYPEISQLVGIDINKHMVKYALRQAQARQMSERVHFRVRDALDTLDFPDASFDLVNQRFGASWLRQWEWLPLLREYQRICKPAGVIRITECDVGESSSSALERLADLLVHALFQAGYSFTRERNGLSSHLASLLQQAQFEHIQTRKSVMEYHGGTVPGKLFAENLKRLYRTLESFLRKWIRLPANYDEIFKQAFIDMDQPGFVATWTVLTAWGTNQP